MSRLVTRHRETKVDPVLTRIVETDRIPWYKKPNLRYLYLMASPGSARTPYKCTWVYK